MDLFVELPDGSSKHVPVSLNCSVRAATQSCVVRAGMSSIASKLSEFSLAKKTEGTNPLIDVCWLDEGLKVKEQGCEDGSINLILMKKYYTANTDLSLVRSSPALLRNLYCQFRRAYVTGLYRCTQPEAAQLSALIARAEFSLSELRPGSLQKTGRLQSIVPPTHFTSSDMEREILKSLSSVTNLTEAKAQENFVDLVSKLHTFGLSLHTITLVDGGGGTREALLGVGPQLITVMETHNLQPLMQWKMKDLTAHSYNDTTFNMTCGSDSITMVTKQGHMISAFLSGMAAQSDRPSPSAPHPKKPLRPQRSLASVMENGHDDSNGLSDRTCSTHIKTVGQQVERYEVQLKKSRPLPRPRPTPPTRPAHPPKPRHAPLRVTQSVPIHSRPKSSVPVGPPPRPDRGKEPTYEVPIQKPKPQARGSGNSEIQSGSPRLRDSVWLNVREKETSAQSVAKLKEMYGTPIVKGEEPTGRSPHLDKFEEPRYESSDMIEGPLQSSPVPSTTKPHSPLPPLPPLPQSRKPPKPAPISTAANLSSVRLHKSDSDVPLENGREDPPESPIYDELLPSPEYATPEPQTPGLPPPRPPKPTIFSSSSNPLSPPPPSSPAPPPPDSPTRSPRRSSTQAPPLPRAPPPDPSDYDTLTPDEDMKEVEFVFGSKDLPMQVKYSCNTNPIYDTLAATQMKSSLNVSQVTYHSFTNTLERKRKLDVKKTAPKPASQQQAIASPSSSVASSTSPPVPPSPQEYENSELLSLLLKKVSPRHSPTRELEPSLPAASEPTTQGEKPKKRPPPPFTKSKSAAQILRPPTERGSPHNLADIATPSVGYSRLEHFKHRPSVPQLQIERTSDSVSDDNADEHEYAEVDYNAPRKVAKPGKNRLNHPEKTGWVGVQNESSTPPPIPPLRGSEWEMKKLGPPKPPRARQRWDKKVDKGPEGKGHKAVKNTDALRDYSTLMQDFRMFHVKLPTGVLHTDMANVKSEVGKLIRRLCVLLCVPETDHDHYSLYVEGTPHTLLAEMVDDDGAEEGGVLRKLRQKSPSRQDLFGSRFFVSLSERSNNPVLLNPNVSFKSQGITTSRILALRPQTMLPAKMTRFQIQVPDWVRFHQCWLSVVQGNLMATQAEAVKLAALQYQAYFLDRTELNSVIGFCRSSDFLPLNFATVKGLEEKVYAEQQKLKGYTRLQAQDSYIFTACSLPTYNTVFFHCQEAKRKILRKNTKLSSVLIGINQVGVVRLDYKTREILDTWPYQVLKNWGHTEQTFILEFDDRTYPLKTSQGRWMNVLVDFHIEAILGDMTTPPVTHQEMGGARMGEEAVPLTHSREDVDEIYSDLLSVRAQAQQWLMGETAANGKLPSSSSSPPSSSPSPPHHPHTSHSPDTSNQRLSPVQEPADYEEVEFGSPGNCQKPVGYYDVLRKEWQEDDDTIYDVPPES